MDAIKKKMQAMKVNMDSEIVIFVMINIFILFIMIITKRHHHHTIQSPSSWSSSLSSSSWQSSPSWSWWCRWRRTTRWTGQMSASKLPRMLRWKYWSVDEYEIIMKMLWMIMLTNGFPHLIHNWLIAHHVKSSYLDQKKTKRVNFVCLHLCVTQSVFRWKKSLCVKCLC